MSDKSHPIISSCLAVLLSMAANVASMRTAGAEPFPEPVNTQPSQTTPLPAADLVKSLTLPPGFQATVFASEPDVQQQIAGGFGSSRTTRTPIARPTAR